MGNSKTVKNIINTLYIAGVLVVISLVSLIIIGSSIILFPDDMIPYSLRDYAVFGLAFGFIPMLILSLSMYRLNGINVSIHKKRNLFLVFLPCFICGLCLLVIITIILIMMIQGILYVARS